MPNSKEFSETPITTWIVTDSDGTVVQLDSNADITIPPKDFIESMREHSFQNPEVGIMVLSGRKDSDLNKFYKDAFKPSSDGKTPKVVLASENGAYFRLSTAPEKLLAQEEPLSDPIKTAITLAVSTPSKKYYTDTNENLDQSKLSVRLEMKDFGCTCHFRTPSNENDIEVLEGIKAEIKKEFLKLVTENPDLHADFEASSAFTLERVSKGITLQKLADHSLKTNFQADGIPLGVTQTMSYTGDDRGDWPSFKVLNKKLNEGSLEGYTARPCNHSPNTGDVSTRISNSPSQIDGKENFYILGTSSISAQEIHRGFIFDTKITKELNDLRKELDKFKLLPEVGNETPPVVLLQTRDILIQAPEKYTPEILESLKNWKAPTLVIVANDQPMLEKLIKLYKENPNIVVAHKDGLYQKGDLVPDSAALIQEKLEINGIISGSLKHSSEIQFLRGIENACLKSSLLQKKVTSEVKSTEASSKLGALTVASVEESLVEKRKPSDRVKSPPIKKPKI